MAESPAKIYTAERARRRPSLGVEGGMTERAT
jgi:hypothetical protein